MAHVANPNEPAGAMEDLNSIKDAIRDMRSAPTEVLLRTAAEVVAGKVVDNLVFDSTAEAQVPKFDKHELTIGCVLGRGGFCVVREIKKIKTGESSSEGGSMLPRRSLFKMLRRPFKTEKKSTPSSTAVPGSAESNIESFADVKMSRDSVASRSKGTRTRSCYVIKQVAFELKNDDMLTFLKGVVDLAMETKFLSALNHPNIIKLCGAYTGGPYTEGYFVVLEKLSETLTKRIKKWMDVSRRCEGITGGFRGSKRRLEDLMAERLLASSDIALGGAYLHSRKVMFRDLKPDNIGYDSNGVLKLFDFGLARELKESERTANGLYNLTGFTGAVRYMAPEVGLGKPYNEKSDVYSWSMLMWYMLALEPPFGMYSEDMLADRVFKGRERPQVFKRWPAAVSKLMKKAWHEDIAERPSFQKIRRVLKQELSPTAVLQESLTGIAG